MALSPQFLDELRARTQLSALVGRSVKLTRAANEMKACCPFHDEKTPSFYVNDAKGFYHCFGCQAHGDAIRWMMEQHGLPFIESVKELAAGAGMEMPAPDPRAAQAAEERAGLHEVCQAAQDWFEDNLRESGGAAARAYLEKRGINARTIERFGFGYAPGGRQSLARALSKFDEDLLVEAGLRIRAEGKPEYDRFRDRLMLPIRDARGRVIAFGGRILADVEGAPKYLNSPDTPLFDKGRTLYNLDKAAKVARKAGRIVVAEGYMDVIALAAAGIEEAVAPMGTALTEMQLELLWRQADRPVLCFDGDAAGQRAAGKAIARALPRPAPGRTLGFATLPAGLDPDDMIRRDGPRAMEKLLDAPQGLLDRLWDGEKSAAPLATPEDKAGLKARLMAHVETIEDRDIAALYRRELLDRFSAFAFPRRERQPFTPRPRGPSGFKPRPMPLERQAAARLEAIVGGGARDRLAAGIFAGLVRFPDQIGRHASALAALAETRADLAPAIDGLIEMSEMLEPQGGFPISGDEAFARVPDNARFAFLLEATDPIAAREDLAQAVSLLVERPALEAALAAATQRFEHDPEAAFAEQQRLLKRKLDFEARLGQMAGARAGPPAIEETTP